MPFYGIENITPFKIIFSASFVLEHKKEILRMAINMWN